MLNRFLTAVLRVFFHLLYHQLAFTYDFVAWAVSLGMWKDWIKSAASEITGPRALELGHGPGHLQILLLASQISTFGLDISTQMGWQAKKRITARGYKHKLINGKSQPGGKLVIVPVAWITGKGFLKRAAAALFRVTGQAREWDNEYLEPFIKAGFRVEVIHKKLSNSLVLILLAHKPI